MKLLLILSEYFDHSNRYDVCECFNNFILDFIQLRRCYYTGNVIGEPSSRVALSLCDGGVRGTVQVRSENTTLAIYPLPHDSLSSEINSDAHVVVKINDPNVLQAEFDGEKTFYWPRVYLLLEDT